MARQAGAELGQAQVKLEVIVKVGVEDRCIYFILRDIKLFQRVGGWVGCGGYVVGGGCGK